MPSTHAFQTGLVALCLTACGIDADDPAHLRQPIVGASTTRTGVARISVGTSRDYTGLLLAPDLVLTTKGVVAGRSPSQVTVTHSFITYSGGGGSDAGVSPVSSTSTTETRPVADIIYHASLDVAVLYLQTGFSVGEYALPTIDSRSPDALVDLACRGFDTAGLESVTARRTAYTTSTFDIATSSGSLSAEDRGVICFDDRYRLASGIALSNIRQLALSSLRPWVTAMKRVAKVRAKGARPLALYVLDSTSTERCATADAAGGASGAPCTGAQSQRYLLDSTTSSALPALLNVQTGTCLALDVSIGSGVVWTLSHKPCSGAPSQAFDLGWFASGSGLRITNLFAAQCLTDGAPLLTLACGSTGNSNQRWYMRY